MRSSGTKLRSVKPSARRQAVAGSRRPMPDLAMKWTCGQEDREIPMIRRVRASVGIAVPRS